MPEVNSFYLNGLGDGTLRHGEEIILNHHRKLGIRVTAAHVNWRKAETVADLRDRIAEQAGAILFSMGEADRFLIHASSAGVWLALAVRNELDDSRVRVMGHSGRVRRGDLAAMDPRTLERCAHLGSSTESQTFYEGVQYCEDVIIPRMTPSHKDATLLTTPFAGIDEIVPGSTMPIEGVENIIMPAVGHLWAIGYGMYRMPALLQKIL